MALAARIRSLQTFRALRHRNYRYLWLGQVGHAASLWMDQVARAVLVLQLTDSAIALSAVIATRLVPILLFGLLAGAIADRADRKRILLSTQLVTFGTHLFLGIAIIGGFIELWHVVVTAFIAGTGMAFNQPVRQSLIPMTVPREDLLNAVALNATAVSLMRVGGGSIAGLLLIPFSTGGVYLITAGIYVFVTFTTVMLVLPPKSGPAKAGKSIAGDLAEGFSYIRQRPELGLVTMLALILFVFGFPYQQVFTPLLATRTLDMGESGVGFLAGVTGVGAVIGTLFVASRGAVKRPGIQLVINMLVFGAALVLLSLQANIIITSLCLAVAGAMTVTYIAFTNSILLDNSDPEMHGRVMSLLSLDRGLIPLGAILAGFLVESIGVRPGLFTLGAIVLVLSGLALLVWGRRLAEIRTTGVVRKGHSPPPEPSPAASVDSPPAAAR